MSSQFNLDSIYERLEEMAYRISILEKHIVSKIGIHGQILNRPNVYDRIGPDSYPKTFNKKAAEHLRRDSSTNSIKPLLLVDYSDLYSQFYSSLNTINEYKSKMTGVEVRFFERNVHFFF